MEIENEWAGHTVACPVCQHSFPVPRLTAAQSRSQRTAFRGTKIKAKRGGYFGKLILLLLVLVAGSFGFAMVRYSESPQQVWARLTDGVGKMLHPPQITQTTPALTPESTPEPTATPVPEATEDSEPEPTMTPTPVPAATPDALSWLLEHKNRWPKQVTLLEPTDFPVMFNGKIAGSAKVPRGSKVQVLGIDAERVAATFGGANQRVAIKATDLRERAEAEMAKGDEPSVPNMAAADSMEPAASPVEEATPSPTPNASTSFTPQEKVSGQSVTLHETDKGIILSNGIVTATITKGASISSLKYKNSEMGSAYYSMDGGANYRTPGGGQYFVKTKSPDLIDIGFKNVRKNEPQALDCEIHYVIKRGTSGIYTYAILSHPADYPKSGYGEWRCVWKLSDDLMEKIYVDDLRHWQMPSVEDYKTAEPTGIKEIIKLTKGPWAGKFDCKYDYNASYYDLGCWGHASDKHKIGGWMVVGGYDYFNDGPTKQDLNAARGINHIHFGMNHYGGSTAHVEAGEEWQKIYGPFLLYCNHNEQGGDAMWADAKKQVDIEKAAWPYTWLTDNPAYPPANARGTLTGRLVIKDALKPKLNAANAWVGLAQPPPGGNWQFESNHYQYWAKADAAGNFTIPNVRPGTYTFYTFTNGAVGEFSRENVMVKVGTNKLPEDVVWEVPHKGRSIAWEIGIPDRTAKEFRHGTDYFHGYVWTHFQEEFKNPLEYTVGKSDWSKDWNFAHSSYQVGDKKNVPWRWSIHFDLATVHSGEATMTFAFASAHGGAHINVYVNNEEKPFGTVTPSIQGGNALLRESIHAKYCVEYLTIPTSRLKQGPNTITLEQVRTDTQTHVMYDYLNLELP